ncbi:NfeD family protein [Melghirimyces algeriensis]|uniref:Membrane protein NfeD2 N-terminal transmembrane domain-containing protein n=1 Tax=Melghirimyces algeriensis TaxID=910412 RepID=A0A521EXL6_9BACL|nr:NfeD family protein [Melghirimyces algeriensis]SMO88732.1 hypothetical protein SAMN06264849_11159 [Melghirimyces algeriensis]
MDWSLVFWCSFFTGLLLTVIIWLLGDLLEGLFEGVIGASSPFLAPILWTGGLTAFGASGILLTQTTALEGLTLILSSLGIAATISILLYLLVVKPAENAERSSSFRMADLTDREGEVITTIPAVGYGEVLIWTGGGHTNQIASSLLHQSIPQGARVIIHKVEDDTLWVTPVEKNQNNKG